MSAGRPFFFGSADPAPSVTQAADDGTLVVLRGIDRRPVEIATEVPANEDDFQLDFVFGRIVRGAGVDEWCGLIHKYHRQFGFVSFLLDPGGGGSLIQTGLRKYEQTVDGVKQRVMPLVSRDEDRVMDGLAILTMLRLRDPGIQAVWTDIMGDDVLKAYAHREFKRALDLNRIGCVKPDKEWTREETAGWTEDERMTPKVLDKGLRQLSKISIATNSEGNPQFTTRGVQKFLSQGRDDVAMGMIYAYLAFLVWLRMGGAQEAAADTGGGGGDGFILL